jgi:hypothetical protein
MLLWLEYLGDSILPYLQSIWGEVGGLIFFTFLEAAFGHLRKAKILPEDSHPNWTNYSKGETTQLLRTKETKQGGQYCEIKLWTDNLELNVYKKQNSDFHC